jgi:hypothetical protein
MTDVLKTIRPRGTAGQTVNWEPVCAALLAAQQQAFKQCLQTFQVVSEQFSAIAAERVQLAMEGYSMLSACRSPAELIDWGRRMTARMTDRCAGEFDTLSQIAAKMALVRPEGNP